MDGPVECLKVLPCVDINHHPHVTFLGPRDAWCKNACKYKHLFELDMKLAYGMVHARVAQKTRKRDIFTSFYDVRFVKDLR